LDKVCVTIVYSHSAWVYAIAGIKAFY